MTPHKKNVLFRPFPAEEKTSGGIIVSEAHREISNKGEIVDVGSMVTKVKKGDVVFKVKSNGAASWCHEVDVDGEKLYLFNEDAILSIQ